MGVYNSNYDLLKKSIESILNQTYANFEFIICDDCSTNDVKKVIQEYQEKDSRIIYLKNDHNRGLAYSLNRCIDTSSGNYIARQDDDDISLETRFEKQVSFLNTNPQYDFVGCNHFLKDEGGIWGETKLISSPQKKICFLELLFHIQLLW